MATRPKKRDAGKTKGAEETKPLKPDKKGKNRKQDDDDDDDDDDDMGPASAAPLAEPKFVPKGGQGFRVKFEIPFRAKDIFRELCRPDEPLGLDKEFTSVDVVQPGVGGPGKVFSVGFIRKSTFKNKLLGNTRARLTELDDGIIVDEATGKVTDTKHKALTWQVISADMPIAIRGTKRAPECTIEVEQVLSGSVMAVTYDYEYAEAVPPCCCISPILPWAINTLVTRSLLKSDNLFADHMLERGYVDINELSATRLQAVAKAFAVRRAELRAKVTKDKKKAREEEEEEEEAKRPGAAPSRPVRVGAAAEADKGGEAPTKASRPQRGAAKTSFKPGAEGAGKAAVNEPSAPSRPQRPQKVNFGGAAAGAAGAGAAVAGAGAVVGGGAASAGDDAGFSTMKVIDDDDDDGGGSALKVIDDDDDD